MSNALPSCRAARGPRATSRSIATAEAADPRPISRPRCTPMSCRRCSSRGIDADIVLDLHSADDALMHLYFGAARWPDGADLSAELGSVATLLAADSGGEPFDEVFGNIWAKLRALLGGDSPILDATMSA